MTKSRKNKSKTRRDPESDRLARLARSKTLRAVMAQKAKSMAAEEVGRLLDQGPRALRGGCPIDLVNDTVTRLDTALSVLEACSR